jgi:acetate kinase
MVDDGPERVVLALNSGSSSLKFGLYRVGAARTETLLSGEAAAIGDTGANFAARGARGKVLVSEAAAIPDQRDAIIRVGRLLADAKMPAPAAIGHRIVHGGPKLRRHCLIDDAVLRQLEAAAAFAPLHTPPALSVIRFAREHFPEVPQVACFDTTFHAGLPEVARVLPVPKEFQSEGIQRYGFHGLSCESIMRQLGDDPPERAVIAHLGNGASITAVKRGKSIDTSMGLTPTGGVIMGTRSGDLDPGVLVYLMREKKFDAAMLEELVDHRSGLLGISGIGGDMRRLHEAASSNADARLAVEMFCYSARKEVAAMIAVLGGMDLLVFTGGIGENDAKVRAAICAGLSWIGVGLDEARNRSAADPISDPKSRCAVRVLASQEDEQIARHTSQLIDGRETPGQRTAIR